MLARVCSAARPDVPLQRRCSAQARLLQLREKFALFEEESCVINTSAHSALSSPRHHDVTKRININLLEQFLPVFQLTTSTRSSLLLHLRPFPLPRCCCSVESVDPFVSRRKFGRSSAEDDFISAVISRHDLFSRFCGTRS